MKVFTTIDETSAEALKNGEQYYKTSLEYYKLKIFQQLTITLSIFFKLLVIGGLIILGLIFLIIASAIALGNALKSMILSCFLIGVFMILVGIIVYLKRKFINKIIIQKISSSFFN